MNFKTTIALVITLAILLGAFFLLKDRQPPVTTVNESAQPLVFQQDLTEDDVVGLDIQRDGQAFTFVKEDSAWVQTQPVRWKLNEWRVQTLEAELIKLAYAEKFVPGSAGNPSLADVKLDAPAAVVTMHIDEDGERSSHTVKLGRTTLGGKGYAMVEGDSEVIVVADRLHTLLLDEGPAQWRQQSVNFPSVTQAQQVTFTFAGTPITVTQEGGNWQFAQPYAGRVSADKVRDLLQLARGLRIESFAKDNPDAGDLARFGLAQPAVAIDVVSRVGDGVAGDGVSGEASAGAQTTRLLLGAPVTVGEAKRYAALIEGDESIRSVLVVTIEDLAKLQPTVNALREPRVATLAADDINRISIERAELENFTLEHKAEGWTFVGEDAPPFEPTADAVDKLIKAVTSASAVTFEAGEQPADATPLATITLGALSSGEPQVLRVLYAFDAPGDAAGSTTARRYVVMREGSDVPYDVPAEQLKPVFEPVVAMRSNTVVNVKAAELTSLQVERPGEPVVSLVRRDGRWRTALGQNVETEAVDALVKAVAPLRAKQWHPGLDERVRLAQPWVLTLQAGEASHVLHVWPDAKLARLADTATLFTIDDELAQAITRELRHRTILSLGGDALVSIEVHDADQVNVAAWEDGPMPQPLVQPRTPARPLVLRRDPAGVYTSPNDVTVNQGAAARLADTLGGLRAERFVPMQAGELGHVDRVFRLTPRAGNAITLLVAHRTAGRQTSPVVAKLPVAPDDQPQWFTVREEDLAAMMADLVVADE